MSKITTIAFDLDGTLTQHRSPLNEDNRRMLYELSEKYHLVMVGAGEARRIFNQMEQFPIDIIGNYGMQHCRYDPEKKDLDIYIDEHVDCNRDSVSERITMLRKKYGYTEYTGDNVEFHPSGCVTFPLLGTKAKIEDKLAFDPDRKKRLVFYQDVKDTFPEFTVVVGGSSSFDFIPFPFNKYHALDRYCKMNGLDHENVVYVGDDYHIGGNDEVVYNSDFRFICVDSYLKVRECLKDLL